VTIRCLDGASNQWVVEGSESGTLFGPFTGGLTAQDVGGQFTLTFTPGSPVRTEDRLSFGLMAGSHDAGVQKKLLFGDVAAGLNGGKSKLTVAPGAGLSLQGTAAAPTVVDRISGGANYYTFSSSGALSLANAQVQNADKDGLQLSGTGGVSISSSVFDFMGVTGGQANAFLTARDLTSAATFYAVTFGVSRSTAGASAAYNVRVQGSDAGLSWYFRGHAGGLSGAANDFDPNGRVNWAENVPPSTPGSFIAAAGSNEGEIRLTWTSPGDDGMTGSIIGGTFLIYRSTVASAAAAATPSLAQTVISTTAAPGSAQGMTVTGLSLATSYYFRLWAGDEVNNYSSLAAGATAQALRVTPLPVNGLTALASANQVVLGWTDPAAPPAAYQGAYLIEVSSVSSGGPFTALASVPALATGYTDSGLQFGTTYYYRIYTTDLAGGTAGTSAAAAASARTQDLPAPQASFSVLPRLTGATRTPTLSILFTKAMAFGPTSGAVSLSRLRDRLGGALSPPESVPITVSSNVAGDVYGVALATAALEGNSLYELAVSAAATDAFGKAMASSATVRFTTYLDHTVRNVVVDALSGAVVDLPAGALAADGYVAGGAPPAGVAAATQKLVSNAGGALPAPLGGAAASLGAYDTADVPQTFTAPVTVSLPFADVSPADGLVDGTRVKVKTLAVHWLDESRNVWVRLNSTVDTASGTVSARAPHFTTFAAIGAADADVSAAYAFPSPWRKGSGVAAVTFTGVGQGGRVEIYAADGRKVREVSDENMDGIVDWDVKESGGEPAASGVYFYRVMNAGNEKTGKLAVIR
jgi:hypothetical protein